MRWPPVYWIFAALLICGCGGQRVGFDPFGRTTIPPPPTAMRSANADPYYSGVQSTSPPPLVALPQGTTVSAPVSLAAAPSKTSVGGWRAAGAPAAESAVAVSPPPGRLLPVPNYVDNSSNTSITLTAGNPDAWTANDNGTADFQQAVGNNISTANSSLQPYQVRYGSDLSRTYDPLAPLSEPRGGNLTKRWAEPGIDSSSGPFGHASDYTWLKGRLEYEAGQRQWTLRYEPVDAQSDAFGGSVVLSALSELENYRSGDMVIVQGRLAGLDGRPGDQAFDVTRLERQ